MPELPVVKKDLRESWGQVSANLRSERGLTNKTPFDSMRRTLEKRGKNQTILQNVQKTAKIRKSPRRTTGRPPKGLEKKGRIPEGTGGKKSHY